MDVIYADVLFARNAVLDYLLLLSAARLARAPLRRGRFALAAALGGVYAAAAAVPPLAFLSGLLPALGASLAMGLAAYGRPPGLWRCWGCFLALSAAVAGAVYAVGALTGQRGPVFTASPRLMLLAFGSCCAAVGLLSPGFLRAREREILSVEIRLRTRTVSLSALRDTGNQLLDPLSGAEILVADTAALAPLFPEGTLEHLPEDPAERFRRLSALPELRGRLRLVPFSALGTERGLLLCFRPDALTVAGRETSALTGLSPVPIRGDYDAVY